MVSQKGQVTMPKACRDRGYLRARTGGATTVPQIFVDGEHLGDEETLAELEQQGKLDAALKIGTA